MFTFSKNFNQKPSLEFKKHYSALNFILSFIKLFIKIDCFEKYIEQSVFYAIGGTPFPLEMFLFFIK